MNYEYVSIGNSLRGQLRAGDVADPHHSAAWIAPDGTFYVTGDAAHSEAAEAMTERGIIRPGTFPTWRLIYYGWNDDGTYRGYGNARIYYDQEYSGYEWLARLGYVHLWYNGEFWVQKRGQDDDTQDGRVTADQFFALQLVARDADHRTVTRNIEAGLRRYGGQKYLDEYKDVPGTWYAPEFSMEAV